MRSTLASLQALITLAALASLLAGCTKSSPVECTGDADCDLAPSGKCIDVAGGHHWCAHADATCLGAFRFSSYDVGDNLAGSCVDTAAITCEPATFQACTGDGATFCKATGDGYEPRSCALGCTVAGGCRQCETNQTTCSGKTLSTCDANGRVTATEECALGCVDGEARCKEIVPSNDLGQFVAMAKQAPDVVLNDEDMVDAEGWVWRDNMKTSLQVPTRLLAAPKDGVPVRVYIVSSISMGNISFNPLVITDDPRAPRPAIAIVAARQITIRGYLNIGTLHRPWDYPSGWSVTPGPGSIMQGACVGTNGNPDTTGSQSQGGAGGGAGATGGGNGGQVPGLPFRSGGLSFENADLVPLRGGCAGGSIDFNYPLGGYAGGAIQLVSGKTITVRTQAVIDANGAAGVGNVEESNAIGGGGAGGGILLEAPHVVLEDGAIVVANGGSGGTRGNHGKYGQLAEMSAPAVTCRVPSEACSSSGAGGAGNVPPGNGGVATVGGYSGGGGGSVGYIRINTGDSTFEKGPRVVLSPRPSTGIIRSQ